MMAERIGSDNADDPVLDVRSGFYSQHSLCTTQAAVDSPSTPRVSNAKTGRAAIYLKALRTLGPTWALARTRILLLKKCGALERRAPLEQWSDQSLDRILMDEVPRQADSYFEWRLDNSPAFFFQDVLDLRKFGLTSEASIHAADQILDGRFPFFGYSVNAGFPPNWKRNPVSQAPAPGGHWSAIDDSTIEDIKQWWELNRFSWAFWLGRAYIRNPDERYPEAFWNLVESWIAQNPPNWGINWTCGQEASFRCMALCFAFYAFRAAASSNSDRVALFLSLIAAHGQRIDAFHEYAHAQKNNHAISEGVGLWTIGLLFPELKNSARWRNRGKCIVESEVRRQVYADGSYIQHSTNYHRVLLQTLAWALRLGECNADAFPSGVYCSFRKAIQFLQLLTDSGTGLAPNCGANDGALVLPLSDCSFSDMRPSLQACHFLANGNRLYPSGPWDEEMILINGPMAAAAETRRDVNFNLELNADSGGYYTIRSDSSWAMLRGAKYRDRPSHADQLHVDLWWRGENVLCDSGSYSYHSKPPFDHAFASTLYHNTVTIDGRDQMKRISRFLWADWTSANVRRSQGPRGTVFLEGEHDGYAKSGVIHRRAIALAEESIWLVIDDLIGDGEHIARLHWQTPDVPCVFREAGSMDLAFPAGNVRIQVASNVSCKADLVRAGERVDDLGGEPPDPSRGWISRFYRRMQPALSFVIESSSALPVRFVTFVMLEKVPEVHVDFTSQSIQIGDTILRLSRPGDPKGIVAAQ